MVDLIAIGFARSEADASEAEGHARDVLKRYGNLRSLSEAGPAEIAGAMTLDEFESLRAQALMELGRRTANAGKGPRDSIETAEDVLAHLEELQDEKREHFYAILLDSKSRILRKVKVHIGTLTMSVIGPREVFREAIREGASSVIVAHNHPSGDPTPSPEDIEATKELVKIGKLLDIPVLDHVIVGERDFRSLHRMGLM